MTSAIAAAELIVADPVVSPWNADGSAGRSHYGRTGEKDVHEALDMAEASGRGDYGTHAEESL